MSIIECIRGFRKERLHRPVGAKSKENLFPRRLFGAQEFRKPKTTMLRTVAILVALLAVGVFVLIEYVSPIKPVSQSFPELPHLELNHKLIKAEHLFTGDWHGPEALAVDPANKMLYTGTWCPRSSEFN